MSGTDRVEELDAVRGIAACVVVLHHCWQTVLPDQNTFPFQIGSETSSSIARHLALWISLSPLRLLFAGHAAVAIFFVLSGFVLTKSLQKSTGTGYFPYVVRRLFRIWVPFAVVILCAAGLCFLLAPEPLPNRPWINESWNSPVSVGIVAGHLLMYGFGPYVNLDSPMWSVVHELRISLIFPVVVLLTVRFPRLVLAVSGLVFVLLSLGRVRDPIAASIDSDMARQFVLSFFDTIRYSLLFMIGILLAVNVAGVRRWLTQRTRMRLLMWLLVACLLWLPYEAALIDFAYALGAFGLLALCISSERVRTVLRHSILSWLGKVSYSLYLVHLVVLLALVHLLGRLWSAYAILPLVIVCSLVVAWITNRYLEVPCNSFGKRLARLLEFETRRPSAETSDVGIAALARAAAGGPQATISRNLAANATPLESE